VKFGKYTYQKCQYETGTISFMFYYRGPPVWFMLVISFKLQVEILIMFESKFILGSQASWGSVIDKLEAG